MKTLARFAAVALFLTALPLAAQTGTWTAVASAGAVDDSSLASFAKTAVGFQHASGALGTIYARYSVTNTYGLDDTPPWTTLDLGYYDFSSQGHVSVLLFQVDPCTGVATLICVKSSVETTTGAGCVSCPILQPIDFSKYNYVVEVQVTRSSVNAIPIARTLRIY